MASKVQIERAFLNFIELRCETHAGTKVPFRELFDGWSQFLRDYGLEPETAWSFGRRLTLRGFGSKNIKDTVHRTGVQLKRSVTASAAVVPARQAPVTPTSRPKEINGFVIERDVPFPRGAIQEIVKVLRAMTEGDSVFFPGQNTKDHGKLQSARGYVANNKFMIVQSEKDDVAGYRVFHAGAKK